MNQKPVVDVGANCGLFTSVAACEYSRHGDPSHVIAIEPNPACVEALRMNVDRNNQHSAVSSLLRAGDCDAACLGKVSVVEAACGMKGDGPATILTVYDSVSGWGSTKPDEDEVRRKMRDYVDMLLEGDSAGAAGGSLGAAGKLIAGILPRAVVVQLFSQFWLSRWLGNKREVRVPILTLSEALRIVGEGDGHPIDVVKVDVERAELDVLRGIEDRDWERIEQLVVEVHDENIDGAVRLLDGRGFVTQLDRNDAGLRVLFAHRRV